MANVLDKIGTNIKKKIEENKKEHTKEIVVDSKTEVLIIENREFDYENVDTDVAEFLKKQESNIKAIVAKAYTEIGKILMEAQERLADHHGGIFEKWYESLGFKKDKVYRLISRYKLVLANCENKIVIENLPLSLSYEISKENCPEELREMVLSGEIKTLKDFNEAKKTEEKAIKVEVKKEELIEKLQQFEIKYEIIRDNLFAKMNKLESEKRLKLYKEIKSFEKKLEKILKEE